MSPCRIEGCFAKVTPPGACHEHGGQPRYEERTDIYGATTYSFHHEMCCSPEQLPPQSDDMREYHDG